MFLFMRSECCIQLSTMSGYPSLTLKSHTVSSSVTDSFVKPAEEAHWLGALVSKLRNLLVNPSLFGVQ